MAKTRKNPVHITSIGPGDKPIVGGLFEMHDRKGFSLVDSIWTLSRNGAIPDIPDFIRQAIKAGWPAARVAAKVRAAFREADNPVGDVEMFIIEGYAAKVESEQANV